MFESREANARANRSVHAARCLSGSTRSSSSAGFTLVELMLVVAIVGVLASVAIPRAKHILLRAHRAEAYLALDGMYTAQTAYIAEVGQYSSTFESLGFELEGGVAISPTQIDGNYYRFQLQTFDINGNPDANFSVVATADLVPGDDVFDVLMIENNIIIKD